VIEPGVAHAQLLTAAPSVADGLVRVACGRRCAEQRFPSLS
jgi:hypothetical protein